MKQPFVPLHTLNSLVYACEEEINSAYIYEYIQHILEEKHVQIKKNVQIFYSYLYLTKEYQITYYESAKKALVIFEYLDNSQDCLYIYKDFFAVILNQKLYYYQVLSTNREVYEIEEYVYRRLGITKIKTVLLSGLPHTSRFNTMCYLQKAMYTYTLSFTAYLMVLFTVFLLTLSYYSEQSVLHQLSFNQEARTYKKLQKSITFTPTLYNKSLHLLNTIEQLEITLRHFQYEQQHFSISVASHHKQALYDFLKQYETAVLQSNIEYEVQEKMYVLHTTFVSS